MQWNARFCLGHKAIHTLTFGLTEPAHFDQINGIFPASTPLTPADQRIKQILDEQKLLDPYSAFNPYIFENDPSGLNIPEILRFRTLLKCYDMKEFGLYRYNMFQEKDHWFPGSFPTEENLRKIDLSLCPPEVPVVELIRETHRELFRPKAK
jgi:predicted aldo/keto reductase-like oxidoreductase